MNKDQILSLAGMFQAGYLVRELARTGTIPEAPFRVMLASILKTDANTTEDVYGGSEGARLGLQTLSTLFETNQKQRDLEIARYVLGVVYLRKKLFRNKLLLDKLTQGVARIQSQNEFFDITSDSAIANLARIYTDTVSQLQPRIVVNGEQGYLNNPENANKVRALLLALMRSAVLWHQKGGRRWHLIFSRAKIVKTARVLLTYSSGERL